MNTALNEQEDLEKEKYLWQLLHILYVDEQTKQENELLNEEEEDKENTIGTNELLLETHLLKTQPLFRRIKLIIDWLEKIFAESKSLNLVKQKIGEFNEKCTGWEHTLHHLKHSNSAFNKKERLNTYSTREFVDELDPDAPLRQGKSLHDLDQEDEYKLAEYIYSFVRAGELNAARDFCFRIGQSWRAATLEGFKLFNDKNYFSSAQDEYHNDSNFTMMQTNNQIYLNEGNFNRDIWRLMVQRLIKDVCFITL